VAYVVIDSDVASQIAATCLVYGLPLATLNTKDFADFAEHDGLTLITG
jgi:predicted nucleic acid-binding protein